MRIAFIAAACMVLTASAVDVSLATSNPAYFVQNGSGVTPAGGEPHHTNKKKDKKKVEEEEEVEEEGGDDESEEEEEVEEDKDE